MMRLACALLALGPLVGGCQPHASITKPLGIVVQEDLRRLDDEQARLVQAGDEAGMAALLHPDYVAHAPNGRLYGYEQTLALIRSGALARERFERTQERVTVSGTTGIVTGVDRLEVAPPLAQRGERTRRYTNVYVRENGAWKLIARHFHLLP